MIDKPHEPERPVEIHVFIGGRSNYDYIAERLMMTLRAQALILVVVDGALGNGAVLKELGTAEEVRAREPALETLLRHMADDLKKRKL